MRIIAIVITIFSFNIYADISISQALSELTTSINNVCSYSWCKGQFNWQYENLLCDFEAQQCKIDVKLIESFDVRRESRGPFFDEMSLLDGFSKTLINFEEFLTLEKECTIKGIQSIEHLRSNNSGRKLLISSLLACGKKMEDLYYSHSEQAEVIGRIKKCNNVESLSVNKSYSQSQMVNGRHYYDEYQTWLDLLKYARTSFGNITPREFDISSLASSKNQDEFFCKRSLKYIKENYYSLGLATKKTWTEEEDQDLAFIFTKKKTNTQIRVILKRYTH